MMPAFLFLLVPSFLLEEFPLIQFCRINIAKFIAELDVCGRILLSMLLPFHHILPFLPCLEFRLANFAASSPPANSAENSDSCVFRCGVFEYFSTAFFSAFRLAIITHLPFYFQRGAAIYAKRRLPVFSSYEDL